MADVVTIAGSPSKQSKSSAVLSTARAYLEHQGLTTDAVSLHNLNTEELFYARSDGASVRLEAAKIEQARAVIIATPIYKAAYTGILKAFLDLLPQAALANKVVFPIATGGSPAHLLAIDYALKPVLSALGAHYILSGLYILDSQFRLNGDSFQLETEIEQRLDASLQIIVQQIARLELAPVGLK